MLHIVWSVIVGFVRGLVARALLPGADPMGSLSTTILRTVGSVVGGFVGDLVKKPAEGATFHPAGSFMSVLGAVLMFDL